MSVNLRAYAVGQSHPRCPEFFIRGGRGTCQATGNQPAGTERGGTLSVSYTSGLSLPLRVVTLSLVLWCSLWRTEESMARPNGREGAHE